MKGAWTHPPPLMVASRPCFRYPRATRESEPDPMPHITVPENVPGIRALLAFRPETAGPLGALADALLHAPNSLPPGHRELIAAYVSARNNCPFCHHSHAAIAACQLPDGESLVAEVVRDPE